MSITSWITAALPHSQIDTLVQSIFSREAAPSKPELRGTLPQTNRPALPESDSDEAVVSEQSSASSDAEFDGELPPLDSDFEEEDEDHEETLQQQV